MFMLPNNSQFWKIVYFDAKITFGWVASPEIGKAGRHEGPKSELTQMANLKVNRRQFSSLRRSRSSKTKGKLNNEVRKVLMRDSKPVPENPSRRGVFPARPKGFCPTCN